MRSQDAQPDDGSSRVRLTAPPGLASQAKVDAARARAAQKKQRAEGAKQQGSSGPPHKRIKLEHNAPRIDSSTGPSRTSGHAHGVAGSSRGPFGNFDGLVDAKKPHEEAPARPRDARPPPASAKPPPNAPTAPKAMREAGVLKEKEAVDGKDRPADQPRKKSRKRKAKGNKADDAQHPQVAPVDETSVACFRSLPQDDAKGFVERMLLSAGFKPLRLKSKRRRGFVLAVLEGANRAQEAATVLNMQCFEGRQPMVAVDRGEQSQRRPLSVMNTPVCGMSPHPRSPSAMPDRVVQTPARHVDVLVHNLSRACLQSMPWHKETLERETRQALANAARSGFQVDDHYVQDLELIMEGRHVELPIEAQPETVVAHALAEGEDDELEIYSPPPASSPVVVVEETRSAAEPEALVLEIDDDAAPAIIEKQTRNVITLSDDEERIPAKSKSDAPQEDRQPAGHRKDSAAVADRRKHADVVFPHQIYETISSSPQLLTDIYAFLQTFLQLFDENRGSLVDYYGTSATFSYSALGRLPQFPRLVEGKSRDVRRRGQAKLLLAHGPQNILAVLRTLPAVAHDFDKAFVYDHWSLGDGEDSQIVCHVHGQWEEFLSNETRAFSRMMVLTPCPPNHVVPGLKWQVASDQLIVRPHAQLLASLRTASTVDDQAKHVEEPPQTPRIKEERRRSDVKPQRDHIKSEPGMHDVDAGLDLALDSSSDEDDSATTAAAPAAQLIDSTVAFFTPPSLPAAPQKRTKMRAFFDVGTSHLAVAKSGEVLKWNKRRGRTSVKTFLRATSGMDVHCAARSADHGLLFMGQQTIKGSAASQLAVLLPSNDSLSRFVQLSGKPHADGVSALFALPATSDRAIVATGGWDHRIILHSLDIVDPQDEPHAEALPVEHRAVVQALEWSTSHDCLLSSGADGRVMGYDLAKMSVREELKWKEPVRVSQIQEHPTKRDLLLLTTSTPADQLRLFDLRDRSPVSSFGFASRAMLNLSSFARGAFSPDGELFALPAEDAIRIFDIRNIREAVQVIKSPSPGAVQVCFESERELAVLESSAFAYHRIVL